MTKKAVFRETVCFSRQRTRRKGPVYAGFKDVPDPSGSKLKAPAQSPPIAANSAISSSTTPNRRTKACRAPASGRRLANQRCASPCSAENGLSLNRLSQARETSPPGSRNLLAPDERYVRFLDRQIRPARELLHAHGLKGFHDLRAAYACERYQQLTGSPAPVEILDLVSFAIGGRHDQTLFRSSERR